MSIDNHALALSIIEAKNAEVRALTQRAEAAEREKRCLEEIARCESQHAIGLTAERDALRKDAARLDWLETQTEIGPADSDFPDLTRRWLQVTGYEATLRQIIDAALAVQP